MRKIIAIAGIVVAAGVIGLSIYADAYDPVRDKGMQTIERQAVKQEAEVLENRETEKKVSKEVDSSVKAQAEMKEWEKLSREDKLKLIEQKRIERRKKTDESWNRKSADKKIAEYEKRLKKRTLSKEERKKIEMAKLSEKCSTVEEQE